MLVSVGGTPAKRLFISTRSAEDEEEGGERKLSRVYVGSVGQPRPERKWLLVDCGQMSRQVVPKYVGWQQGEEGAKKKEREPRERESWNGR